jgi:hypothetical protein
MSEPIKPNPTPIFYNTIIPSLTDDANIQEALRMYHYGTPDGTIPDDSANPIRSESIASYLNNLQSDINDFGIGSSYSITEPTDPEDGSVWMDGSSSASVLLGTVAIYQNDTPVGVFVDGNIWVDKDSSPLTMYVYDADTQSWKAIGS